MSVNWGDYKFTEYEYLSKYNMPHHGGVYVIMFRPDYKNKPLNFRAVYFGMANNFSTRGINENHHAYNCWKEYANGNILYVSTHKESNESSRESKERILIKKYNPYCNNK